MNKKLVREKLCDITHDFQGPIDTVIAFLENLKIKYSSYLNIELQYDYYGYEGGFEIEIFGERPENDQERQKRLATIKKIREIKNKSRELTLEKERKEFERLRKKFEHENKQ